MRNFADIGVAGLHDVLSLRIRPVFSGRSVSRNPRRVLPGAPTKHCPVLRHNYLRNRLNCHALNVLRKEDSLGGDCRFVEFCGAAVRGRDRP